MSTHQIHSHSVNRRIRRTVLAALIAEMLVSFSASAQTDDKMAKKDAKMMAKEDKKMKHKAGDDKMMKKDAKMMKKDDQAASKL